jgi:hypothetical protein
MDGLTRGVLGILLGAALYSEVYPVLQENVLKVGVYGKLTLPGLVGLNHWAVILPLIAILGGLLLWFDRRGM